MGCQYGNAAQPMNNQHTAWPHHYYIVLPHHTIATVNTTVLSCLQVPMASSSGLRVSYLKVLERKQGAAYKVDKWVRKMTKSGDYLIRT